MALSNSKNYTDSFTAADIISQALRKLGAFDIGETIDPTEQADALIALNLIIKELSVQTPDNWLRQKGALFLAGPKPINYYTLGPTGSKAAYSWYETKLTASAASSATSITVDAVDATHSINTANIGIKLDSGDIFFTTISGSPTTTITLASGLTSAASSGARVYIYAITYQISRPLRLISAQRVLNSTTTSGTFNVLEEQTYDVNLIGRMEYDSLTQKRQEGVPLNIHYQPDITNGTLYVWPTGLTSGADYDKLYLTYNIYIDDFDLTTNNAQFPPEWHNALVWSLAAELAFDYGLSTTERRELWAIANNKINTLLDVDVENASIRFERAYNR